MEQATTTIQHWWRRILKEKACRWCGRNDKTPDGHCIECMLMDTYGNPDPCEDCGSKEKRMGGSACHPCYYRDRYGPGGWDSYCDSD